MILPDLAAFSSSDKPAYNKVAQGDRKLIKLQIKEKVGFGRISSRNDLVKTTAFSPYILWLLLIVALLVEGCSSASPVGLNENVAPTRSVNLPLVQQSGSPDQTPQPGLLIKGYVALEDGSGLPEVKIYRNFASYEGVLVATTDQEGLYQADFVYIPGDEMVAVWAELDGYTFDPEYYRWRHYYGYEESTLDFVAAPNP